MTKLSIGVRLTLLYLSIFAIAQICFGLGMWVLLRQHLYGIADRSLTAQVEDLTNLIRAQKKKNMSVAKMQEEVSESYVLQHSGDYLQVYDQDGNWIFRAPTLEKANLPPVKPADVRRPSFQRVQLGNEPYRFITQRIEVNGRAYTVETGVSLDQINRTLSVFRNFLLALAPIVFVLAAIVGYWLSRKALSPVDAITQTARNIGAGNLNDRLEKITTGDELERLSDTLNDMLARIESAFRRITQFTADASHELRTPIALIRTEAEVALGRSRSSEEYRTALRHILLESERTSTLIEELLFLARADSGREDLDLEPVDLESVVLDAAAEWRRLVEARNLHFNEVIPHCESIILADRTALRRVLTILLDNAAKYTPPEGSVELRFETHEDKAVIEVQDTGIGIAEEDQSKIFERFYRVDEARSRDLSGAGIGLAIASWIVRQHHGRIEVKSSIGLGSTFSVDLPLQAVTETAGFHDPKYART